MKMNLNDLFNALLKESDEDRYDYKRFQPCDKKFLRFWGINNAKDWNSLSKERKESLLKEMHY